MQLRPRERAPSGICPAAGGDPSGRIPLLRNPARGPEKDAVATARAGAFRDLPAAGGDPSGRIPLLRNPARGPKKVHRVGLASVQLTRSTFAEATAGRECLQPSALRARCTRKPSREFRPRQAPPSVLGRKLRYFPFPWTNSAREVTPSVNSTQKMHRGQCSLVRPTDRRPPKRLPVGEPSTSGAPSSVHPGH